MLKRFFKDTAIYAIATAITGSLSLLLLPYLTRKVTIQEYGIMDLLLSTFSIVNILVPLSISQALARFFPQAKPKEKALYASTGFWFTFVMFVLFTFLIFAFLDQITMILSGNIKYKSTVFYGFFSMMTFGIFYYLQAQLRWMLKPSKYMISTIIFICISCLLTFILIQYYKMQTDGFFIARIIASFFAGILCWHYAKENYQFSINKKILIQMLKFSFPLVISSVGIFISIYIDRFLIRALLPLTDLGIYGACARLASVAGSAMTVINFSLTPLVYSKFEEPTTRFHLAFIFKIIIYILLLTNVFLFLFSKQILIFFMGPQYGEGYLILPFLVSSFVISGLYNCVPGLWIANKTKLIAFINIFSAIVNTALCMLLIPHLGYLGAAVATFFSAILSLFTLIIFSQRYYQVSYEWIKINFAILLTIGFVFIIVHRS